MWCERFFFQELKQQAEAMEFDIALKALSVFRFISGQVDRCVQFSWGIWDKHLGAEMGFLHPDLMSMAGTFIPGLEHNPMLRHKFHYIPWGLLQGKTVT